MKCKSETLPSRDTTGLQQVLAFEEDGILPSPKDVRQHRATVMIDGMPSPPWLHFLPYITPHLIAF